MGLVPKLGGRDRAGEDAWHSSESSKSWDLMRPSASIMDKQMSTSPSHRDTHYFNLGEVTDL